MFRGILSLLIFASLLLGQNYRWPIRASQSLSATFAEYRSGHLHAGIDIKTWGEMEVPCLAIADGYIEQVVLGYNGYGRGLWLRLNDGSVAVYGHLEQFTPLIESLIRSEQINQDKYSLRLRFAPDQYPVRMGNIIGYSGTSGTEHPHLHFEIRDSLGQVENPQFFYSGINDSKAPVLDEIMLIPVGSQSRINGSLHPVILDMGSEHKTVSTTGPFRVAINAHDRANGTYNKYNIFRAEIQVNDSIRFERTFDRVSRRLTDDIDKVYPGAKGKRGWRFMSMYNENLNEAAPFTPDALNGTIHPAGLSELQVSVSDIQGNSTSKKLIFHEQVTARWDLQWDDDHYVITRYFPENGYENIQFYSGSNNYLPVSETLYRLTSSSWVLGAHNLSAGVRALGAAGGMIKWIIPPQNQENPELDYSWKRKDHGYVLRVESKNPHVFPLAYSLTSGDTHHLGELIQTTPRQVESEVIPLDLAVLANQVDFLLGSEVIDSLSLSPMEQLAPGQFKTYNLELIDAQALVKNTGSAALYLNIDTTTATYNNQDVMGVIIKVTHQTGSSFSGTLSFLSEREEAALAIFEPGKKKSWKRLVSPDSSQQFTIDINEGGSFFLLEDQTPPRVKPLKPYTSVRRGERLVFKILEDTKVISYPRSGIKATLDGTSFFPDYNPLRHELSFHIPRRLGAGQHIFEFSIRDVSGNATTYRHPFSLSS